MGNQRAIGRRAELELVREAKRHGIDAFRLGQSRGAKSDGDDVYLFATLERGVITPTPGVPFAPIQVESKRRKKFGVQDIANECEAGRVVYVRAVGASRGDAARFFAVPEKLALDLNHDDMDPFLSDWIRRSALPAQGVAPATALGFIVPLEVTEREAAPVRFYAVPTRAFWEIAQEWAR